MTEKKKKKKKKRKKKKDKKMIDWCNNGIVAVIIIIKSLSVKYSSIYGGQNIPGICFKFFHPPQIFFLINKRAGMKTDEIRSAKYWQVHWGSLYYTIWTYT